PELGRPSTGPKYGVCCWGAPPGTLRLTGQQWLQTLRQRTLSRVRETTGQAAVRINRTALLGADHLGRRRARNRKVTPTRDPGDTKGDDRLCGDLHSRKLGVSSAQQALGLIVLAAVRQDVGVTVQHHPAEP